MSPLVGVDMVSSSATAKTVYSTMNTFDLIMYPGVFEVRQVDGIIVVQPNGGF